MLGEQGAYTPIPRKTPLTTQSIANAPLPKGESVVLWDTVVPGFGVRLFASGRKVFIFQYRTRSRQQRRMTGALVGTVTLDRARSWAKEQHAAVRYGHDPAGERKAAEQRDPDAPVFTVDSVVDEFTKLHLEGRGRSPNYLRDSRNIFRRFVLPAWGERDIRSITRREVIGLLDSIMDRGTPILANRAHSTVSKLLGWCVERDLIEHSPADRVARPASERERERVLSDDELVAVWQAAKVLRYPWGPFFRMLLATGCRESEVSKLRWESIDLGARTWTLSATDTKGKRATVVPLSKAAVDVLERIGPRGDGYVFESRDGGAIRAFSYGKILLFQELGENIAHFRIHDLRRTVGTGLGRLGVQPHVIAAVLNHAPSGITRKVYNLYSYFDEKESESARTLG